MPGSATLQFKRTPDTGGDLYRLVPTALVMATQDKTDLDVLMELDGVFWITGFGLSSEDTVTDASGNVYRVFQNGGRTQLYSYMAVKEA